METNNVKADISGVTLLTEQGVAEVLCLSVHTVRQMRIRGDGPPFIKMNTSVRYRLSDLKDYIQGMHSRVSTSNKPRAVKAAKQEKEVAAEQPQGPPKGVQLTMFDVFGNEEAR
jgi:hypothetical protein